MNKTLLLLSLLCMAGSAAAEEGVIDKTERGIKHGAEVTTHAVKRGLDAAGRGLKRAGEATEHGLEVAADATKRGVQRAGEATENAGHRVKEKLSPD